MSKRDRDIFLIEGLIDKYRLDQPVEGDYRKFTLQSKSRVYKKVMRKLGKYTLLAGLFSYLYFSIKKSGLLSFVVKIIAIITAGLALIIGSYYLYKYLTDVDVPAIQTTVDKQAPANVDEPKKEELKPEIHYSLHIKPFIGTNVSKSNLRKVAYYFNREFGRLRGGDFATLSVDGLKKKPVYALQGSVDAFGNELIMFVKLVNTSNTQIIYTTKEIIASEKELPSVCSKLAKKVSEKLK